MRADAIRVAVRPRGILECLDLAVLVCGRRPLAVALATAAGALPCIAVNRLLFAGIGPQGSLAAFVALGVEMAWASVPLTLYLGQAVFSARFSWRTAARAFGGSLPALIVFQGVLRAVCLATVILAPVVFVGMYHLDEVILLERPGLSKVWGRRQSVHRRSGGSVLSLAVVDAIVLASGTMVGITFLASIGRLWRGFAPVSPGAAGTGLVPTLMSWNGQIAFWSVCGFLAIFRFFTYLDGRIRREGWDVELRLRADETYAGLARAERGAPRTTTRVLVTIVVLAVALVQGVARAAGDGGGAAARQALGRQGFPWYDASTDRYRSLIEPRRTAPERSTAERETDSAQRRHVDRDRGGGHGGNGGRGGGGKGPGSGGRADPPPVSLPRPPEVVTAAARWLLVVLLVAAVAGLVAVVVWYGLGTGRPTAAADDAIAERAAEPAAESLPAGVRLADGDLLARCAAEADRGDYAAAMLLFHAWLLVELHRRGDLVLERGKTNGRYATEVAASAPALVSLFRASSGLFEDAFFGRLPVSRGGFLAVWDRRGLVVPVPEPVGSGP